MIMLHGPYNGRVIYIDAVQVVAVEAFMDYFEHSIVHLDGGAAIEVREYASQVHRLLEQERR